MFDKKDIKSVERINEIRSLVDSGIDSLDSIAEKTGLSIWGVRNYARWAGIKLPTRTSNKSRLSYEERRDRVKKAIEEGAFSLDDIVSKTGVNDVYAHRILREFGNVKERRANVLRKAIDDDVKSLEELCKRAGVKDPQSVWRYCKKFGIEMPENLESWRYKPEIDKLIDRGLTLEDIGNEVGLTRERVRQYIKYSGQHSYWEKKRREAKEVLGIGEEAKRKLKNVQGLFLSCVQARAIELAKKEDWALQKTVEYFNSLKYASTRTSASQSVVYKIFKLYENAKKNRKKLTLEEIGEKVGLWQTSVGNILSRVGVEPMYGKIIGQIKRREKMKATLRGKNTEFSNIDIAYFLRLPEHVPGLRFNARNIHRGTKRQTIKQFGEYDKTTHLTYRLASQIYEAVDCGFKRKETAELVETYNGVIRYAIQNRDEIEPKIVRGLKRLYNDRKVKTPYVTAKMREKLEKEG